MRLHFSEKKTCLNITLLLFLTKLGIVWKAEKSFSKLKVIKIYLRFTVRDDNLSRLAKMFFGNEKDRPTTAMTKGIIKLCTQKCWNVSISHWRGRPREYFWGKPLVLVRATASIWEWLWLADTGRRTAKMSRHTDIVKKTTMFTF